MATRTLLAVISASPKRCFMLKTQPSISSSSSLHFQIESRKIHRLARSFSSDSNSSVLEPPDVSRLAESARISLTQAEIEECEPKIRQVIDWFGKLQQVDVTSVEPAIRAEMEGGNLREDAPETFENSFVVQYGWTDSFSAPVLVLPSMFF